MNKYIRELPDILIAMSAGALIMLALIAGVTSLYQIIKGITCSN
jgi:hypothetical protein